MQGGESGLSKISVLYVDDEPALLDIGKIFLEKTNSFSVAIITSAKDALNLLSEKSFDAIVSDYQMPGMDGIEFLKEIRGRGNTTPFLIFTGKGREEIVIEALNEGADFYIQKGGSPKSQFAELAHKIKKAVQAKRAEDALEKRILTLTQPDIEETVLFEELFNIEEIQQIQDDFALATGVASIITKPDGTPITKPSCFTRLCSDIIRKTKKGCENCYKSDASIGKPCLSGPVISVCLSGGLWDAGAGIIINGHHIANWLAGQVRNEAQNEDSMREYAKEIGVDETLFMEAYYEVPSMSQERFQHVAKALFTIATQLSKYAYQNIAQARSITEREKAEDKLRRRTEELHAAYEELTVSEEELQSNLEEITKKEEELQKSKKQLSDIIEFLPDPTFVIDTEGKVIAWNHATELMTNVKKEDILNKGNYEYSLIFYDKRRPMLIDLVIDFNEDAKKLYPFIKKEGKKLISEIFSQKFNDGKGAYYMFSASPLYDSSGNIAGAIESIRDISERKIYEENLKESGKKLEEIIEFLPDATFVIDMQGRVIAWNRALEEMTGVLKHDILNKDNYEYSLPYYNERRKMLIDLVIDFDESTAKKYPEILKTGDKLVSEIYLPDSKLAKGSYFWFTASPLYDSSGNITGAIESIRDISERKKAEDKLRESENLYRTTFETTGAAAIIINSDTIIAKANSVFAELSGYTTEEIEGKKSWTEFVHPDDLEMMIKYHKDRRSFSKKVSNRYEFRFVNRNKEIKYCLNYVGLIPESSQSIASLIDITERKRAEETLAESEERYRSVVEEQTELICRYLPDGTHLFVNDAYCRYFGFLREEIIGKKVQSKIPPEDLAIFKEHLNSLTPQNPAGTIEQRIIFPDKTVRWFVWNDRAIFNKKGELEEYLSVGRDITDRKLAEETLAESEEKYRLLIENINDIVYTITTDGVFTFVSPAALEIFGYPELHSRGKSFLNYIHPDDAETCMNALNHVKETGERVKNIEYRIRHSNGTWHWNTSSVVPTRDKTGEITGFEGIAIDITERKLAEEAIRFANRKLNILSGITRHDILNLIMVISASLEIARDYATDKELVKSLDKIQNAAASIQRQIEFTREYENLGVEKPIWTDIFKVIEKTANENIKLFNNCKNISVNADSMLEKVFANLMDNTLMHGGSATEVHTECIISGDELKIIWQDNGTGVSDFEKELIFKRGYGKNTGFGLFLTKEILSITGMSIKETGVFGNGARFEITVPAGGWKTIEK